MTMVQTDGPHRQVYIKFTDFQYLQDLLHSTTCQSEYKHDNGEISQVKIEVAVMGTRRVRLAGLPPETPDEAVTFAFSQYGQIKEMQLESWSKAYRYKVYTGIRIVVNALTKHIPSHMTIAGERVLISYEGQLTTCYGCGETGHFNQFCPKRRRVWFATPKEPTASWADIAASGTRSPRSDGGEKGEEANHQSTQTGYGNERRAEDGEAMQADNAHSTGVELEQSKEPDRGAVSGSDIRNDEKAPCFEGRLGVEDSMDCGEEILGDTHATVECQPILQQPQGARTTMEAREEEERERGGQEIRSGEVVEDRTQPVEEMRTATTSSSSKRTKKMRIESIGERTHVRKRSRTRTHSPSK